MPLYQDNTVSQNPAGTRQTYLPADQNNQTFVTAQYQQPLSYGSPQELTSPHYQLGPPTPIYVQQGDHLVPMLLTHTPVGTMQAQAVPASYQPITAATAATADHATANSGSEPSAQGSVSTYPTTTGSASGDTKNTQLDEGILSSEPESTLAGDAEKGSPTNKPIRSRLNNGNRQKSEVSVSDYNVPGRYPRNLD
jgi:hypothetical protein